MTKIDRNGVSYVNRMVSTAIAPVVIFFIAAGSARIASAWVFFISFVLLNLFNIIFLMIINTVLLNERGRTQKDIKKQDHIYVSLYLLLTHLLSPLFAGLEIRFFHSVYFNVYLVFVGISLLILSGIIENLAMYHNRYYERNIRIQIDRDQVVVTGGPYRIIRHPGYLSYILRFIAFPVLVPTYSSSVAILAGIIILILRTRYEDMVLEHELAGYGDYKKAVKYRLVPFLW